MGMANVLFVESSFFYEIILKEFVVAFIKKKKERISAPLSFF